MAIITARYCQPANARITVRPVSLAPPSSLGGVPPRPGRPTLDKKVGWPLPVTTTGNRLTNAKTESPVRARWRRSSTGPGPGRSDGGGPAPNSARCARSRAASAQNRPGRHWRTNQPVREPRRHGGKVNRSPKPHKRLQGAQLDDLGGGYCGFRFGLRGKRQRFLRASPFGSLDGAGLDGFQFGEQGIGSGASAVCLGLGGGFGRFGVHCAIS